MSHAVSTSNMLQTFQLIPLFGFQNPYCKINSFHWLSPLSPVQSVYQSQCPWQTGGKLCPLHRRVFTFSQRSTNRQTDQPTNRPTTRLLELIGAAKNQIEIKHKSVLDKKNLWWLTAWRCNCKLNQFFNMRALTYWEEKSWATHYHRVICFRHFNFKPYQFYQSHLFFIFFSFVCFFLCIGATIRTRWESKSLPYAQFFLVSF